MNLWHDVSLGKNAPEEINVIVEIPKGSHNKYELDKESGIIKLDRANYSDAPYPVEYAFAPRTLWDDGDAIDVLLLATWNVPTGVLVETRPVALMEMIDEGESDYKILGVPVKDQRWNDVQDLDDINQHTLKEIKHFFETYKELKGGKVTVPRFGPKQEALDAVTKSMQLYKDKFGE